MKTKNLTKLYSYEPIRTKTNGEYSTTWRIKGIIYLNLQQDLNELDRNSAGEIDYTIYKGRTDKSVNLQNGEGISYKASNKPDYIVKSSLNIGKSYVYTLNKYNGE